jgi:competence protein ComFC
VLLDLARDLSHFIYPPLCLACKSVRDPANPEFCATCGDSLSALASLPACSRCAAPIPEGGSCPFCHGSGIPPFRQVVSLGPFREPLRDMVHEMKYHHRWPLAETLGDRMLREKRIRDLLDEIDVLIPMPLFWSRQIRRGYNQADALARRLAKHKKSLAVANPIIRLKNTPGQTTVNSAADRAANVRFAFGLVNPKPIKGKRVALVDDVLTTGSTLKSAARAMEEAEPASISAIVLAVADPRRRDFQGV